MKRIWLNILVLLAFLGAEFAALHFMGNCNPRSEYGAILGMTALIVGALYSALLVFEIRRAET